MWNWVPTMDVISAALVVWREAGAFVLLCGCMGSVPRSHYLLWDDGDSLLSGCCAVGVPSWLLKYINYEMYARSNQCKSA